MTVRSQSSSYDHITYLYLYLLVLYNHHFNDLILSCFLLSILAYIIHFLVPKRPFPCISCWLFFSYCFHLPYYSANVSTTTCIIKVAFFACWDQPMYWIQLTYLSYGSSGVLRVDDTIAGLLHSVIQGLEGYALFKHAKDAVVVRLHLLCR